MSTIQLPTIKPHSRALRALLLSIRAVGRGPLLLVVILARLHRAPRTRAAIVHGDHILLVRDTMGSNAWSLPGGGYDRDESGEQCAAREVREELGMVLDPSDFHTLGNYTQQSWSMVWQYDCFVVTLDPGREYYIQPNIEILDAAWAPLDQLRPLTAQYVHDAAKSMRKQ